MEDVVTSSEATQADATPTPQAGNPTTQLAPDSPAEPETISLDEARKLRQEAASLRKRLKTFEDEQAKKQEADMSAAEKEKKRADDLQAAKEQTEGKLKRLAILHTARDEADRLKLSFNPGALEDAYKLGAFDGIELDEEGNPQNVGKALESLQKTKPYLLKTATREVPDLDADKRGGTQSGAMTDERRAELRRRARI